jgi:two-component system, chemotaxis family, chemotaxis protein CheY
MAKTIITVDDAATMRKLIGFTLRAAGHNVLEAEDGMRALALLTARDVDLVITDINMPNMNGIDLTRRLRLLSRHRSTPILVVTTESDTTVKNQAKAAGATGWILKPFQPDQLVAVVGKVLGC